MKALLLFSVLFGFQTVSFAAELSAQNFKPLSMEADTKARDQILEGCSKLGLTGWALGTTEECRVVAKGGRYTTGTATFCLQDHGSVSRCLRALDGVDVDAGVLAVCANVLDSKTKNSDRIGCVDYFRQSSSVFEADAVQICMKGEGGKFSKARTCLNAIRDRQVDLADLKKCTDIPAFETARGRDDFESCVDRVTAGATLKTESICSRPKTAAKAGAGGPATSGRQ